MGRAVARAVLGRSSWARKPDMARPVVGLGRAVYARPTRPSPAGPWVVGEWSPWEVGLSFGKSLKFWVGSPTPNVEKEKGLGPREVGSSSGKKNFKKFFKTIKFKII